MEIFCYLFYAVNYGQFVGILLFLIVISLHRRTDEAKTVIVHGERECQIYHTVVNRYAVDAATTVGIS